MEKFSAKVSLKKYSLGMVRYAAYAVSDAAYVFISPAGKGAVNVGFTPKQEAGANKAALLRRFKTELEDEKLRSGISDANRDLREFMILKALAYEEPQPARQDDSGLTPEQERELEALIAQVESEIKKETAGKTSNDPLGITKTWEEKYGAEAGRKKK